MFGHFDGDVLGYFSQRPQSSINYVDQNIITYLEQKSICFHASKIQVNPWKSVDIFF